MKTLKNFTIRKRMILPYLAIITIFLLLYSLILIVPRSNINTSRAIVKTTDSMVQDLNEMLTVFSNVMINTSELFLHYDNLQMLSQTNSNIIRNFEEIQTLSSTSF
jgi:hypothetical protein